MSLIIWAGKNWQMIVAGIGIAIMLALGTGLYFKGKAVARAEAQVATLEETVDALETRMKTERYARSMDALKARAADERMRRLNKEISNLQEYVDALEDADRVCLSDNDTERLRFLWK